MKANSNINGIEEINTGKIKFGRVLETKKIATDSGANSPRKKETIQNYLQDVKNGTNNNNDNHQVNTSNTTDYNNVDSNTIKELEKIAGREVKLEIEVMTSLSLPKGLIIKLNAMGMESNSLRGANDGNTFFGVLTQSTNNQDLDNNNKLDFMIKIKDENAEKRIVGRHFRIRFDINERCYFIKDLGCGFGTFMKISSETKLRDSYLINIGNTYIVCTFGLEEYEIDENNIQNGDKVLIIKVFNGDIKTEPYFFNPSQIKRIYIGRDTGCNIIVNDTLLSRVHCTIEYKDDFGWTIMDGKVEDDSNDNKHSTNGTWLYLIDETKIEDGMLFKSSQNVFICHLKNP